MPTDAQSKLLSQTSSDVLQTFQKQLETLDMLKALSPDASKISGQLSQVLKTVVSLPETSREITKISQGIQNLELKWNGNRIFPSFVCILKLMPIPFDRIERDGTTRSKRYAIGFLVCRGYGCPWGA